jgi:hypothetical protein
LAYSLPYMLHFIYSLCCAHGSFFLSILACMQRTRSDDKTLFTRHVYERLAIELVHKKITSKFVSH